MLGILLGLFIVGCIAFAVTAIFFWIIFWTLFIIFKLIWVMVLIGLAIIVIAVGAKILCGITDSIHRFFS